MTAQRPSASSPSTGRAADGPSIVRRATEADLPAVLEIERASFSDPWSLSAFRSALRAPAFFAVAATANRVDGYVVSWCVVDEAELANLAVASQLRGGGIGARLLDSALAHAAENGCRAMFLEVRESNARARALYAARGFETVGRRRRYYREPVEDALILRAPIGAPRA